MDIINIILEIITCPFSILLRANVSGSNFYKFAKPLIIFAVSIVLVVILLLLVYRKQIFCS